MKYILKIQGSGKIPDHIQIRDHEFNLIAYFKIHRPESALRKCNLLDKMEEILKIAHKIPYGKIEPLF